MRVLLINKFLYPRGGDAICTLDTGAVLQELGHAVAYWGMDHPENPVYPNSAHFVPYIDYDAAITIGQNLRRAHNLLYSFTARQRLLDFLKVFKPDIIHLHNFAHQISPSILDAIASRKIPMVMTMHDYKLVCAAYLLNNNGKPCNACANGRYYRCFINKCVKNSLTKSLLNTVEMYLHHTVLHIYDSIDIFVSPSMFLKEMLHSMGFNKRIIVIPNFINSKVILPCYNNKDYLVYVGRLSREKGLQTLLNAVNHLAVELHVVGTGPYESELKRIAQEQKIDNVRFTGYLTGNALHQEIAQSLCVIQPSEWYENNPRSVLEAFAFGKPVIGADIGGIPELIQGATHGMLFSPKDQDELRARIEYCVDHPEEMVTKGKAARAYVEEYHSAEPYYQALMNVYTSVASA